MSEVIRLASLGVRRWGESDLTPIVLDRATACGVLPSEHRSKGCIGLRFDRGGSTSLVHLTNDEALRLADLLRAMAETNIAEGQ